MSLRTFASCALLIGCNAILGQEPSVDAGCAKICNGVCAAVGDPAWGCSADSCAPCALDHASSTCASGACAIAACDPAYDDLDRDPSNGCESPNPLAFAPGKLSLWLRADVGVVSSDGGVTSWVNQADGVGVSTPTAGVPKVDTSSWPALPGMPSVAFGGSDKMAVDLSGMMKTSGSTMFVVYARHGDASMNCLLGSSTYPSNATCCAQAGAALQVGYVNDSKAFGEVYCNSATATSPPNSANAYQPNLVGLWYDPSVPANYFFLNGTTKPATLCPHAPLNLSAPGMLGACPSGATYTGLVGELVVYSALLSDEDRAALESHLHTKWKTL